ncbi:MAG: hypothetical protein ACJZ2K_03645 [Candidatus Poseidoniaceae archaeon]
MNWDSSVAALSDEEIEEIPMGQCGACNAIVALDSESCPSCGVRFGGVTEEELGECGACSAIIPADSESCPECGASFVANDETEATTESEEESEDSEIVEDEIADVETEAITEDSSDEEESEIEDHDSEEEPGSSDAETAESDEEDSVVEEVIEDVSDDEVQVDSEEEIEENKEVEDLDEISDVEDEMDSDEEHEEVSDDEIKEDSDEVTVEESEDNEAEEDSSDDETGEEIPEEEDLKNLEYWRSTVVMAFENLALAIAESGMTASEAFMAVDGNDDNLIDAPELQKGIEKISGEWLTPNQVKAILEYLDTNENNRVDPSELVNALDDLKIGIKPGKFPKSKKVKEFPSKLQKFLMGKSANDIFYPVAYFIMVTMIGLFIANGFAIPGASGEGGTIVYEGSGDNWNHCGTEIGDSLGDTCSGYVSDGETYPCEASIDPNECRNSITIFSGESSDGTFNSMPKGFYLDGIMFIILGIIGLGATAYLHMVYAPSLRKRVKGDDKSVEDSSESEEENADDEGEDEDALDAPKDLEIESPYDDDSDEEDEFEDDEEDETEDDDDDDDDIDIGDWVGIDVDGEEFFGEIIEFDDDEGTVTIETDDGDEVTGDQDDMFLEDDDDDA